MKDEQHPFQKIKYLSKAIFGVSARSASPRNIRYNLFKIEEEQEYNAEYLPMPNFASPRKNSQLNFLMQFETENFAPDIYHQILTNPSEYYEDFKALFLELSFFLDEKDKACLKFLNQNIEKRSQETNPGRVLRAICDWQKEGYPPHPNAWHQPYLYPASFTSVDKRRRELIVQCYLFFIALEKVHYAYLGLIDDPVLKKLFSQGIILTGLIEIYFKNEPKIISFLYNIGVPLAITHDNSLMNLNNGKDFSYMRPIRNYTLEINLYRLGIARVRRLIISVNNFNYFSDVSWWMLKIEPFIRSTMSVINLLYFIPRILSHLLVMIKHVLLTSWMSEEQQQITMIQRFYAQWNRRWESLFRDTLWLINGFLNLYVLLGSYVAWSLPINTFIQSIEMMLNIYLYQQFLQQKEETINYFKDTAFLNMSSSFSKQKNAFLEELYYRYMLEQKNRYMRMMNSILIVISNLLVCTCFATISLYFPLLGAILGVTLTVIQFISRTSWEKEKNALSEPFELPKAYPKETSYKRFVKRTQHGVSGSKMSLGFN